MLTLDADGYFYDSFPNDNPESLFGKLPISSYILVVESVTLHPLYVFNMTISSYSNYRECNIQISGILGSINLICRRYTLKTYLQIAIVHKGHRIEPLGAWDSGSHNFIRSRRSSYANQTGRYICSFLIIHF